MEGFPWDDLRKIFCGCQWMAKVPNGVENHNHHNRFAAIFPGPPGWAGARREVPDFMVQGKINRGRHTDHPAERHSIWTNQCPPCDKFQQAE